MRYYAGNWATTQWLFRKGSGAEERLDTEIVKAAPLVVDQVADIYDRETGGFLLNKGLAFRSMHSHGRALNALLPHAVDDVEAYDVREGELISNVVNGWNFGDGHFHGASCSRRSRSDAASRPGEVRVIALESEPTAGSPSGASSATRSTTRRAGCSRRASSRSRTWSRASRGSTSPSSSRSRSRAARRRGAGPAVAAAPAP